MKHLHILGICGTFMGGVARLAVEKGFHVTGSDQNCYPPMSTQLEQLGVKLHQGYDAAQLKNDIAQSGADIAQSGTDIDCVLVGNAMARGVEVVEALLNSNQRYQSGPEWLKQNILQDKWVLAVAGTHGKTSTASMIAWILEAAGYNPGFLIGGVMENFGVSARYTDSPFFVVEADEYDTAFFDKRSKFVHYRARTVVLNNLEFDHADIFSDLQAIETQFHHLVRTIPGNGLIIRPEQDEALDRVIEKGVWTQVSCFSDRINRQADWWADKLSDDASRFEVYYRGELAGVVEWPLIGEHNLKNALAAIAAVHHVGVLPQDAIAALARFKNVKRRMELKAEINQIRIYDDFAHHPTAIETTLNGLRQKVGKSRIIAVVDPRSNTMKMGLHQDKLLSSVRVADKVIFHIPRDFSWRLQSDEADIGETVEIILAKLLKIAQPGDNILIMSNGGFGGLHDKLIAALVDNNEVIDQ